MDKKTNISRPLFNERRKYERKNVSSGVSYRFGEVSGKGVIKDISEKGMCTLLDKQILPKSVLEMEFRLSKGDSVPIEAVSRVIWSRKSKQGFLTGVKFGL